MGESLNEGFNKFIIVIDPSFFHGQAPDGKLGQGANEYICFFLMGGYGLSCVVLYHYLIPYLGETFSLLTLGVIFFITSFILYGVGYFLKPKEYSPPEIIPKLGEALNQLPNYDLIKKAFSVISPKVLIGLFATAVAAYVINSDKKDA